MVSSWRMVLVTSLLAACTKANGTTAPVAVTVAPTPSPSAGGVDEGALTESAPPGAKASPRVTAPCALEAKLRYDATRPDGYRYALELKNTGSTPLRLVVPGDGSEVGWRTPALTWSATANGKEESAIPAARCGLMNRIEKDEIFTLAPGASRELREWVPPPPFAAGRYAVRLTYRNDPSLVAARGSEDEQVKQLLAGTSTCEVTTNELDVTLP